MLSKEEILDQFDRNEEYDSYFHEDHILKAMDEYAKQELAIWKEKAEEGKKEFNQVWDYSQKLLLVIAKLVKNKLDAEAWSEAEEIIHKFSEAHKHLESLESFNHASH